MKQVALATMCVLSLFVFLPSVSAAESTLPAGVVVLYDSFGYTWTMNFKTKGGVAFLYGNVAVETGTYPSYGFVVGNEMVLWGNIAELYPPYTDSFAYAGMWDFATYTYDGNTINYHAEAGEYWSLEVAMWLGLSSEMKAGPNPLTKQVSSLQRGASPSGVNPRAGVHVAATFQDSNGYMWYLNEKSFMGDIIYYGEVDLGGGDMCPAYGVQDGSEMFLWANGPGIVPYDHSFVYTGMWNYTTYFGAWVNYPVTGVGSNGPVTLWYY